MRLLEWSDFLKHYVERDSSIQIPLSTRPKVSLGWDKESRRVYLEVPWVGLKKRHRGALILKQFDNVSRFFFGANIQDDVAFSFLVLLGSNLRRATPKTCWQIVDEVMKKWAGPMRAEQLLVDENQVIGLFGELWVLREILKRHGVSGLKSWIGVEADGKDFRLRRCDLEVKTTLRSLRQHVISRETQLQSIGKHQLYLCSVMLLRGGTSRDTISALKLAKDCESLIATDTDNTKFREFLQDRFSLDLSRAAKIEEPWKKGYRVGEVPRVYRVDSDFPKILPANLQELRGHGRIILDKYNVDISDLKDWVELGAFLKSGVVA